MIRFEASLGQLGTWCARCRKARGRRFGDRSRVRLSLRFEGLLARILGFATRKLNNRYLAMEAQGLKSKSGGTCECE